MMESIRKVVFFVLPWTIFVPLILAVSQYKKYSTPLKSITLYLILSAVTQIISFLLWKFKVNNLLVLQIYTIAEFMCLLYFYALILEGFIPAQVFYILAIAFPAFSIIDSFVIEKMYRFNNYGRTTEALIFIFLSVCFFIKIVSDLKVNFSSIKDLLFINSGFFIYFSGAMVLFSMNNFIDEAVLSLRLNVWSLFALLTGILYVLITIGLWKRKKA